MEVKAFLVSAIEFILKYHWHFGILNLIILVGHHLYFEKKITVKYFLIYSIFILYGFIGILIFLLMSLKALYDTRSEKLKRTIRKIGNFELINFKH